MKPGQSEFNVWSSGRSNKPQMIGAQIYAWRRTAEHAPSQRQPLNSSSPTISLPSLPRTEQRAERGPSSSSSTVTLLSHLCTTGVAKHRYIQIPIPSSQSRRTAVEACSRLEHRAEGVTEARCGGTLDKLRACCVIAWLADRAYFQSAEATLKQSLEAGAG